MAFHYSPRVVTNGLVLALDAANPNSYPGSGTTWYDLSGNNLHMSLLTELLSSMELMTMRKEQE